MITSIYCIISLVIAKIQADTCGYSVG